jgi:hypothetical protein
MSSQTSRVTPSASGTVVSVAGALRVVESLLLRSGQQTARRNAWSAVLEDRKRAKDRREAQHVLETLGTSGASRNSSPDLL